MNKESSLIQLLKENDSRTIKKIYEDNRTRFIAFASQYNLNGDVILDIYQDAIIALCENAKKGKLDSIQSLISTYLFSIGKFMIFQLLKKDKKILYNTNKNSIKRHQTDYQKTTKHLN